MTEGAVARHLLAISLMQRKQLTLRENNTEENATHAHLLFVIPVVLLVCTAHGVLGKSLHQPL